ncbi:hypothetical protein COCSUDRAFT_60299 [Coccomyxa subellipsoidea C-169]|uniref:Uncharacterized protein n=1 Tax=Coccomyxa subellipsoidea (strain C-169) TaxID=574566 RepID=I0YIW3_COCSC|nr:hypothetical protein COCSUDRAFT_60299 [Coccomyxa subellipsoidea C-169]EIE18332.1 hypothetical protein COCSUDRAFT_60299 [Coccomyxa subellipsoidea C-169]|eukprot:XP_005642876.1 hypothetical protein COCSUDRAFT_60299 [Coccomyxa subellipsoidea C-169]
MDVSVNAPDVLVRRYTTLAAALVLAVLASSRVVQCLDLPVATSGFEEWAGVVAKAMSFGGRNQASSLQALKSFQASVAAKVQQQGAALKKLEKGDISDIIKQLLTQRIDISAPVFFDNAGGPDSLISGSAAGVSFGFVGAQYAPCAIPIAPLGVGVFPQGAIIQPQVLNIAPTGVNIQPQGVNIAPNLIVIGPYDTTVAGQGLNIAPALIAIAPTRTVINPIGPLEISDTLVDAEVPLPPGP